MKWTHLAFLLVPVLGLAELGAHFWFARRPPNEAQWKAAAPKLAGHRREGDLVVVAPQWAEPAARQVLGDALMPVRDVARPDETRYATAMEISIVGQRSKHTLGWRELERHDEGKFVVRRLENPGYQKILYDFVDHVNGEEVTAALTGAQERSCGWSESAQPYSGGLGGPPAFPARRCATPFACRSSPRPACPLRPGSQAAFARSDRHRQSSAPPRRCPTGGGQGCATRGSWR